MVDLVDYLLAQHSAGRVVTDAILKLAPTSRKEGEDRRQLISTMQAFVTIYRPHAAWEDTDLFPKLSRPACREWAGPRWPTSLYLIRHAGAAETLAELIFLARSATARNQF
jgi:hypothetical protein